MKWLPESEASPLDGPVLVAIPYNAGGSCPEENWTHWHYSVARLTAVNEEETMWHSEDVFIYNNPPTHFLHIDESPDG